MKKFLIIIGITLAGAIVVSCNKVRRNPGRIYMPDMTYSRAYETYSTSEEEMQKKGIHYNALPVTGTIARGDDMPFPLTQDKAGDSTNYVASRQIKNPYSKDSIDMTEASRLYLVNCGICHGPKLDGQGPLFTSGAYPAAPKNFMDALMKMMPEGQMFYSVTYGKNMMGSYASQLSTKQRWMVIGYIKSKQESATPAATQAKPADSTGAKGK